MQSTKHAIRSRVAQEPLHDAGPGIVLIHWNEKLEIFKGVLMLDRDWQTSVFVVEMVDIENK
jgi:hypothetical protein